MNKLVIYGASYFDLLKLINAINLDKPTWDVIGFLDDTPEKQAESFWDIPVLGGRENLEVLNKSNDVYIFNNVCGHYKRSEKVAGLLDEYHCRIPNLIHPAIDMHYVNIGRGCILPEGCIVGSNARIGDFLSARLGAVISHDVTIGDHCFVGPGVTIGSAVYLEKGVFIGAGATIMLERHIGKGAVIGAGSLVHCDVSAGKTVAGVPAKELKKGEK